MAVSSEATAPSCYGHTYAVAFQPPLRMCVYCKANPLRASGAYPPKVRSTAANTQADAIFPCIEVRGGAKRRNTPGPHSQQFGGARQRWWIWVHQGGGHLSAFPQPTHNMPWGATHLRIKRFTSDQ